MITYNSLDHFTEFDNYVWQHANTNVSWSAALIEWESSGLEDVPTKNLKEFHAALEVELLKRKTIIKVI